MKLTLTEYDDRLRITTQHGTAIDITVTETKTRVGHAGDTDQIHIHTGHSILVRRYSRDCYTSYQIEVGRDHFPEEMAKVDPHWADGETLDAEEREAIAEERRQIVYRSAEEPEHASCPSAPSVKHH